MRHQPSPSRSNSQRKSTNCQTYSEKMVKTSVMPVSSLLFCMALAWSCVLLVDAAPWGFGRQTQACGDRLADMMSLVCAGRGYNVPFTDRRHRFRRQIVDECCRRSCSPSLLELYCRAKPEEPSSSTQIRKRSESVEDDLKDTHKAGETSPAIPSNLETQNTRDNAIDILDNNQQHREDSSNNQQIAQESTVTNEYNYKLINLLPVSQHSLEKPAQKHTDQQTAHSEKDDPLYEKINLPPLRHHKNLLHSTRQFRGHKAKRPKGESDEASFVIGTVKPYFAGRALASHHTMYQTLGRLS